MARRPTRRQRRPRRACRPCPSPPARPPSCSTPRPHALDPLPHGAGAPRPLSASTRCQAAPARVARRDLAARRAGVPHDVGHRFAQDEAPAPRSSIGRQVHRVASREHLDARGLAASLGAGELVAQPAQVVAAHRVAHLRQRLARDALDVSDLGHRARQVALGQPRRQFRLQDDDRQRVAEQVVQVAPDALAFGDLRQRRPRPARAAAGRSCDRARRGGC